MGNPEIQEMLKKIHLNYITLRTLIDNDLGEIIKEEELKTFLFSTAEGLKLRESMAGFIFDFFMLTHRGERNFDPKLLSLDFVSSSEAQRIKKILSLESLHDYLQSEYFISFKVTPVSKMLLLKFKK